MQIYGISRLFTSLCKKRYLIVLLAFLGYINLYTLRVNLSVAIVAMTDKSSNNSSTVEEHIFDWDQKQKGIILGSFFYGYILTQLMGGYTATKFGGNIIFGGGLAVTSIACLLIPVISKNFGAGGLITLRVIQGIASGLSLPSCHVLFAKWAPEDERSRMISLAFCGIYFGTVISNMLSGVLAANYGWSSIFYVFGVAGLVWYVIWIIVVRKSPEEDSFISENEKKYILSNLNVNHSQSKMNTPWKAIFTSAPVYAIMAGNISSNWGFYTLLTQLPSYLKNTLNFQLASTGFLSAVPYLTMGLILAFCGILADWFKIRGILNITQVRKLFLCGAFIIQGSSLVVVGYLSDPIVCVVLITISIGAGALALSAFMVNPLDIAPQYAGIILGITNTLGTIPGIVSPVLTGFIVTDSTVNEWRTVFYIATAIYIFGIVVYGIFASGEVQSWAKGDSNEDGIDNEAYSVERVAKSTEDTLF